MLKRAMGDPAHVVCRGNTVNRNRRSNRLTAAKYSVIL
jgi:hypothetical protein